MDNVMPAASEGGALVTLGMLTAVQVFAPGAVDPLLAQLKAEVRAVQTDVSTAKGRAEIKSLAYKVARSKTLLDEMGKDLVADMKARTGTIDAERRRIREELDALRDEVRKPVDDFEAAEAVRIAQHEAGIAAFRERAQIYLDAGTEALAARLADVEAMPTAGFQEFTKRAEQAKDATLITLGALIEESLARDAAEAERQRLAAEEAERAWLQAIKDQEEREARIAAEAAEAARLQAEQAAREAAEVEAKRVEEERLAEARRVEAERLAAEEREAAAARAAETERLRVEQERKVAEERAAKAEADRLASEKRAADDKIAAERAAEAAKVEAARREKEVAEAAAKRERDRIAEEQAAAARETARRERDKAHRARINNEALADLVTAGVAEDVARATVTAIAKGSVRHIAISY